MSIKRKIAATAASVLASALFASGALAQTVAVTPNSVNGLVAGGATTPGSVQVVFTNGGANPTGFQVDVVFDPARISVTRTANNPAPGDQIATCTIITGASTGGLDVVRIAVANLGGDPVVNGNYCTLNLSVVANTPAGTYPLAIEGAVNLVSPTGGAVVVSAAPLVPLTLTYSPVPGALPAFGSGVIGTSASQNIAATAAGNTGSASLACTATAGFTVTPSLNFAAAGPQNVAVGCTYGAAAANGSVTCTEIDGDTATPGAARTWTATCPAGSVAPVNPTITTVTPTGAFAMPTGTIGQTVTRPIQFTAAGGAGSGSATIACTAPAPVTVAPANQTVTGSAQPQNVVVSLPLTSAAQGPFTVSCVITDSAGARTNTFDVTAAAGSAFVAPSVVPATSTWSMVALIALMAGFGIALVGFRRNH